MIVWVDKNKCFLASWMVFFINSPHVMPARKGNSISVQETLTFVLCRTFCLLFEWKKRRVLPEGIDKENSVPWLVPSLISYLAITLLEKAFSMHAILIEQWKKVKGKLFMHFTRRKAPLQKSIISKSTTCLPSSAYLLWKKVVCLYTTDHLQFIFCPSSRWPK